jgi:hypothetical protein
MGVPVLLLWQSLVNAIVEVFVVGENNMATDIVELSSLSWGLLAYGMGLLRSLLG